MLLQSIAHEREALEEADSILRMPADELDLPRRIYTWNKHVSLRVAISIERAVLLNRMGRFDEAEKAFDEIAEIEPSGLTFGIRADYHFIRQVALDVIQADIDKSLALEPDYWLGHDQQAHMHSRMNRPEAALAEYAKAAELNPKMGVLRWRRALVLRDLGRVDDATSEALIGLDSDRDLFWRKARALTERGYLSGIRSNPDPTMPAIRDAVRACMLDERCS
jgi:tetratricopeptide (TPR) repeat protein